MALETPPASVQSDGKWRITYVPTGSNAAAVRRVGTWVTEQLKDHRLTLTGRQAFHPDPWISRPIQIDKDGPIVLPFGTIAFDILSEPV